MKVAELEGALLDYWVARVDGLGPCIVNDVDGVVQCTTGYLERFNPSTDWAQGGPIIERAKIELTLKIDPDEKPDEDRPMLWCGHILHSSEDDPYGVGPTPLIAAMRAYVASELGDEVEDIDAQQSAG